MSRTRDHFRFWYCEARDWTAQDGDAAKHTVWYRRRSGQALVMTGVNHHRLRAEQFRKLVEQGRLVKDACPLDEQTDIYVSAEAGR